MSPPDPLVPNDVDLSDYYFMPLDVKRLRDSRIAYAVSGEGFRAAVLLWCAAWHQYPASSLPDDDIELAHLAGFGRSVAEWKSAREEALSGFVKCSDGRLYHPYIAKEALKCWGKKLSMLGRENRRLGIESGLWGVIRRQVFVRDNYTCQYCGLFGAKLECDHIVPVSRGGETVLENLVTACLKCNRSKGNKPVSEWRKK